MDPGVKMFELNAAFSILVEINERSQQNPFAGRSWRDLTYRITSRTEVPMKAKQA
jgi:hypothetical protein